MTASANAVAQPKVHLGMHEGEAFYLGDLLYSLMLESHNDSAVAIAEHLAGSVPQFAGWMNERQKRSDALRYILLRQTDWMERMWAVYTAFQLQIWQKS